MLAGCAAPAKLNTASGRPERTFNASADAVRATLVSHLVNRGYQVTKESQSLVIAEKRAESVMAQVLLGTAYDANVNARASFTIIPQGSTTRVVGDLALVSNPGSAFERVTVITNADELNRMQEAMNGITI